MMPVNRFATYKNDSLTNDHEIFEFTRAPLPVIKPKRKQKTQWYIHYF